MPQQRVEPMSTHLYNELVRMLGENKANELRDQQYPKSPMSYYISYEARKGLKEIAEQLNFTKGTDSKANVSSFLEAIGLGHIWVYIPTPEDIEDRKQDPVGYPYVLPNPQAPDSSVDKPEATESPVMKALAKRGKWSNE